MRAGPLGPNVHLAACILHLVSCVLHAHAPNAKPALLMSSTWVSLRNKPFLAIISRKNAHVQMDHVL